MFQFRRFPSYTYLIQYTIPCGGFPHSEISGSLYICYSPKLIAAYHVLHRLLMPRHSPCALSSLTSSKLAPRNPHPSKDVCLLAPLFLLSNQNPLRWAFDLHLKCGAKLRFAGFESSQLFQDSPIGSLIELNYAGSSFRSFLTKLYFHYPFN